MPEKVRVLIVDDSATMRRLVRLALSRDGRIEVVGDAADPYEARAGIKALSPDVLTLDVEMPGMNGLEFLSRLMRLRPMPVVMLSSETQRGSAAAIEALSLGAVDCIGKPTGADGMAGLAGLAEAVVAASASRPRPAGSGRPMAAPVGGAGCEIGFRAASGRIVLIGASTGGVDAIESILSRFSADCPPTLITQHMSPAFLDSFAQRLDARNRPRVSLAVDGAPLLPGHVYLAPGGDTHLVIRPGPALRCGLVPGDRINGHRPSVDAMFASALAIAPAIVAALLTGMGRDGAAGMADLRRAGAACIAQDEETSVVFGMPRVAVELGGADAVLPLSQIGDAILDRCRLTVPGDPLRAAGIRP